MSVASLAITPKQKHLPVLHVHIYDLCRAGPPLRNADNGGGTYNNSTFAFPWLESARCKRRDVYTEFRRARRWRMVVGVEVGGVVVGVEVGGEKLSPLTPGRPP